jgi:hypothetical protein
LSTSFVPLPPSRALLRSSSEIVVIGSQAVLGQFAED